MNTATGNALIVIDVQQFFINSFTAKIPLKIAEFIRSHKFGLILFTRFINRKDSNWYKAGWKRMMTEEETKIVPELQKFSNSDNTFIKTGFSALRINSIRNILKKNKIIKLYICGLDTHACVYATALDAYEKGYEVRVIEDLCAASHGEKYNITAMEFIVKNLGSKVLISSSEL